MKSLWKHSPARFRIGFISVSFLLFMAFIVTLFYTGPDITHFNTYSRNLDPSWQNLLGTTAMGQDIFWMLLFSLRNSIIIGVIVGTIGTVVGCLWGLSSGFLGNAADRVMMSISDTFIVIPALPVLLLMTALVGGTMGIFVLALIIAIFAWAHPSRHIRAICLSLRERDFIQTARFSGEGMFQIITTEILPYLWTWALSNFMNAILVAIGMETTLAVLGLSSATLPSLGNMIQWARARSAVMMGLWYWIGSPIILVIVLFISLYMLISGYNIYFAKRRGV
ncbi:MAG: ABC transporter permease [Defluviitaleaceae bacterium]|nr:ABC transporter permease [Defluviitaleaceae bacterium]